MSCPQSAAGCLVRPIRLCDFKQLEKGAVSVSVDNRLLALKQKMGMLPAGGTTTNKALGTGTRAEETVAADIERPGDETKR